MRRRDVDNNDLLVYVDLRRRQSHTGGCVHCLSHIPDQFANAVIHDGDRRGDFMQAGIGVLKDGQDCHKCLLI